MATRLPLRAFAIPRLLSRRTQRCPDCSRGLISNSRKPQFQSIRYYSTPTPPESSTPESPAPQETPRPIDLRSQFGSAQNANDNTTPPPKSKRSLRPFIYASLFLLLGLTTGQYVRLVVVPPPLPLPDTREDKLMVEFLTKEAERLPLVRSLSEDPEWRHHDAYSSVPPSSREHRLTTGPLAGARALGGFQRIFYNDGTGEFISVVWLGGAITGWPGVVHGGVTATLMDESLGRCAIKQFPGKSGVTANLELNYRKPIITNSFYVIRAMPLQEDASDSKQWASGRLETLDGRVCVEAKGLFVVPKDLNLKLSSSI